MANACFGYECTCPEFQKGIPSGPYVLCEKCRHTEQIHIREIPRKPVVQGTVKYTAKKKYLGSEPKMGISKPETVLTPKEARARLRAAGIEVGSRGRLSPEQMTKAATL
jgi:hypothetical protein